MDKHLATKTLCLLNELERLGELALKILLVMSPGEVLVTDQMPIQRLHDPIPCGRALSFECYILILPLLLLLRCRCNFNCDIQNGRDPQAREHVHVHSVMFCAQE